MLINNYALMHFESPAVFYINSWMAAEFNAWLIPPHTNSYSQGHKIFQITGYFKRLEETTELQLND